MSHVRRHRADKIRALAQFLISAEWEPHAPTLRYGVYASRWPLGQQTVWTIVNRNEYDVEGPQIELAAEDRHQAAFGFTRGHGEDPRGGLRLSRGGH